MFESVCDCCGKRKSLNVYMLRIERISDPSISIRYDMRESEVIPNDRREEQTIKYLLCSDCYNKTGLPLFSFCKNRKYEFREPMMNFSKCKHCSLNKENVYRCSLTHFADNVCHYAMGDTITPMFGEEPTFCNDYEEIEEETE